MDNTEVGRQRNAWPNVAAKDFKPARGTNTGTPLTGLLTPGDKDKLDKVLFGTNGELLIGPSATTSDYLWRDTSGRIHLRSGFDTMVETNGAVHLAANSYYDATTNQWNRINTATPATLLVVRATTAQVELYTALAGANPITWSASVGVLTPSILLPLDNATASRTANTVALRDANGDIAGGAWNNASFAANWSNLAGYQTVQYRRTTDKKVAIRGNATKATALTAGGDVVFTLPAGFLPPAQLSFPIASFTAATPVLANAVVAPAGGVFVYGGNIAHFSLNGIEFYTD